MNNNLDNQYEIVKGSSINASVSYDMSTEEGAKASKRVIVAIILPIILCFVPAVYFLVVKEMLLMSIFLIFLGVISEMISVCSAVIWNDEENVSYSGKTSSFRVIRAGMIVLSSCFVPIPFLSFILSLIFARRYSDSPAFGKGFNLQIFTFIWSLIIIGTIALYYFLTVNGYA